MRVDHVFAAAIAVASAGAAPARAQTSALPPPLTQNGVSYLCGGVGSDDAAAMKRAAARHNLMLTFATRSGNFVSGVDVDIRDGRGRSLLKTTCDGPIMLVDVPKGGRYRIYGDIDGRTTSAEAQVGPDSKGKAVHLVLPGEAAGQG